MMNNGGAAMTDTQQRAAAKAFAKNWKDRGYEKGDSQIFWVELLTTVFWCNGDITVYFF